MKALLALGDAPYCILRLTDARAYTPAAHTDIRKTFADHQPVLRHAEQCAGDDYDRVLRDDWLSAPGGFRA